MNAKLNCFMLIVSTISMALLAGCDDDEAERSDRVDTGRTYVDMRVSASNTQSVTASVQLLNADPLPDEQLALRGGDELWFSYGQSIDQLTLDSENGLFDAFQALPQKMTRLSGGQDRYRFFWHTWLYGDVWYHGTLDEIEDERYFISYLRKEHRDAPDSYVTLPEIFSISAPLANETYSRANDIVINWEPSDTDLDVQIGVFVDCTNSDDLSYDDLISVPTDTGTYTLPAGTLNNGDVSGTCVTTIEVSKNQTGTIDTGLYGGRIIGERFRSVSFETTN